MILPRPSGHLAAAEIVLGLIRHPADLNIQQRHVEMLPLTSVRAVMNSRQNGNHSIHTGGQVGYRHTHAHRARARLAVSDTGNAHQTGLCLYQIIVARIRRHRACMTKPGDRTVDQSGIDLGQVRITQTFFVEPSGFEVLDQHVALCGQFPDQCLPFLAANIHCHRMLPAVGGKVIG